MEEKKKNTVNINGKEITLKPGTRAILICEEITRKPFELKMTKDVMAYIYASMAVGTEGFAMDWNDFCDAMDDQELLKQCIDIITHHTSLEKVVRLANETDGGPEPKKD